MLDRRFQIDPYQSIRSNFFCRSGGIGRHAVLRGRWRKAVPVRVRPSAPILSFIAVLNGS